MMDFSVVENDLEADEALVVVFSIRSYTVYDGKTDSIDGK